MTIEYAIVDQDAQCLQYGYVYPSIWEASKHSGRGDGVVALDDGSPRPLNAEEEAELQRYRYAGV